MSTKEYFLPRSTAEAVQLLAEHGPSLLVMAGGTVAMPLINEGVSFPERVMGLRHAGLDYVKQDDGHVSIGACTTITQLMSWGEIPALMEAAHSVGGWAIRNMGTVGGNFFAPPPAGDLATMLLALDAQVKLVSEAGERTLPLADFYTGFMTTALEPGELVSEIRFAMPEGRTAYQKFGRTKSHTNSVVTAAAYLQFDGDTVSAANIALSNIGPHPMRRPEVEAALVGNALNDDTIDRAAALAAEDCEPLTDPIASSWYRQKMASVVLARTLAQMLQ